MYLLSLTEKFSIAGSGVLCFVLWEGKVFIREKVCLDKTCLIFSKVNIKSKK